jgi:hypothetical protein
MADTDALRAEWEEPSATTVRVKEMHTLAMHAVCVAIDARVAAERPA